MASLYGSVFYFAADVTDKFFKLIEKIWMLTNIENKS